MNKEKVAALKLFDLIGGQLISNAICLAAELGVADVLKDEDRTSGDIALALSVHEDSLRRLMLALCDVGVFAQVNDGRFRLTEMGALLRSDVPQSLRDWARIWGHEVERNSWGNLQHSIRTGEPAFEAVYGMPIFEYLGKNPSVAAIMNGAMTAASRAASEAVVKAYDFSGFATIADIGGGNGFLLATVLKNAPHARGILLELPHALPGAEALLTAEGVRQRCELIGGDFFRAVPPGADAYLMKYILHDWSDEGCLQLLKKCREAMRLGAKLLIVDRVLGTTNATSFARFADLNMLAMTHGGRERTAEEFSSLTSRSGFKLVAIKSTENPVSVVECVAV
jgi:hypothetical protein